MNGEQPQGDGYGRQTLEEMLAEPRRPQPPEREHEDEAASAPVQRPPSRSTRAALILALLALPGALIPILGLGMGITAIVLGVRARGPDRGRGRASAAVAIGGLAVALSIGSILFAVSQQGGS